MVGAAAFYAVPPGGLEKILEKLVQIGVLEANQTFGVDQGAVYEHADVGVLLGFHHHHQPVFVHKPTPPGRKSVILTIILHIPC
jgi:hypothetical protein